MDEPNQRPSGERSNQRPSRERQNQIPQGEERPDPAGKAVSPAAEEDALRVLARAPADRVILSRRQVEGVLGSRIPLSPPLLREVLGRIPGTDGVTAAELLTALDKLEMSPETTVPTADLMALLS